MTVRFDGRRATVLAGSTDRDASFAAASCRPTGKASSAVKRTRSVQAENVGRAADNESAMSVVLASRSVHWQTSAALALHGSEESNDNRYG